MFWLLVAFYNKTTGNGKKKQNNKHRDIDFHFLEFSMFTYKLEPNYYCWHI